MLKIGSTTPLAIKLGTQSICRLYLGSTLVYDGCASSSSSSSSSRVSSSSSSAGVSSSSSSRVISSSSSAGVSSSSSARSSSSSSSSAAPTPVAVLFVSAVSNATYTVPAGMTRMKAWALGAGGGGEAANAGCLDGYFDGGFGGEAVRTYTVTPGSTVTYTVGAGGAGEVFNTSIAGNGGNTTVTHGGVTITGQGGFGGNTANGTSGTGAGGDFNRSLSATVPYPGDFQGRDAAVALSGGSLYSYVSRGGYIGQYQTGLPGQAGAIVLYFFTP